MARTEYTFSQKQMDYWEAQQEAARAMLAALKELTDACAYVAPIAGAVATKASVKDIRNAGRFMAAVEKAQTAIAAAEAAGIKEKLGDRGPDERR